MKENYYIIAIIAVAVIALLLGALSARLYTNLWEWKAAATDYQAQMDIYIPEVVSEENGTV